ncbi:hypothetical protein B0H19DRAFT_1118091 [Mycena capillaripes]|nr:hypothetical protein B0H19DRAFT_1118091 [Mycena capillaripes]
MRAPTRLDDKRLLEDEPFASAFSGRRAGPKKQMTTNFLLKVLGMLEKEPGGYSAVGEWQRLAFEPDESHDSREYELRKRPEIDGPRNYRLRKLTPKMLQCFIKFYWYLFCGQDAMAYLRSQRFEGYEIKSRQSHIPLIKEEPIDEPMSPLTELSDDDVDWLSAGSLVNMPSAMAANEIPGTGRGSEPKVANIALTSVKVDEPAPLLVFQLHENGFVAPPILVDDKGPQAARKMPHAPVAESEAIPSLHTPVRAKLPQILAPPDRPRRDRPSEALRPAPPADRAPTLLRDDSMMEMPIMFNTLAPPDHRRVGRLPPTRPPAPVLPADTWTSPLLLSGSMMRPTISNTLGRRLEPDHLPTLSVPNETSLPIRLQRAPNGHFPIEHLLGSHDINIRPDQSQEEFECRQLLNASDATENWLYLPAVEPKTESAELQALDLTPKPPKPPLERLPPMWAKARQEVCEALEWFRSYQGGVYQNKGTVKGYFLSAFSAQRDCFECGGKIIISHGGGKAESSRKQYGQVTNKAADDQREEDLSVRALIENYRQGQPLVLLIDDKYGPFPFDLASRGVYMAVLGFYKIIHMWAEYQPSNSNANGRVVRYKFAFQWCEGQGEPWWFKEDLNSGDSEDSSKPEIQPAVAGPSPANIRLVFPVLDLRKLFPRVFRQGWACLHPPCPLFWTMPSGGSLPFKLDYNPNFLAVIDSRPLPISYQDQLLPKPPVLAPKDGITTSYAYSRGWHCRKCGRLSCRSAWEQYECPHCKDIQKIVGNVRPAKTLMSIRVPISDKFIDSVIDDWSGIKRLPTRLFDHKDIPGATGRYQTFELPDGKGKIHLISTNRMANVEVDRIFEAYQQQASDGTLLFRRWPLRNHKLRGPLLTNYFSQNCTLSFFFCLYVGGTDNTVPFDRAPGAVIQARDLIQKRIREALGTPHVFNEVLSAAYMEQQKMAFHSDSEVGLGPVVAGLSMGSPALMHFRLLAKYAPNTEQRANAMTVVLRHGDVLVMEGAGVQNFYE